MKLTSSKPRGQRIFKVAPIKTIRGNKKVIMRRPMAIEPIGSGWWFSITTGEWIQGYDPKQQCVSGYYSMEHDGYKNIWSLKAAKRAIANWDIPKGTWFRVMLPYMGYTFKIRKN